MLITPEKTWVLDKWNDYLKERFKGPIPHDSDFTPSLESPMAPFIVKGHWNDRLKVAWTDFLQHLEWDYIKNVSDAVRKVVPGAVVTAEYPSWCGPHYCFGHQPDPWSGQRFLDVSNVCGTGGPLLGAPDSCIYSNLSLIGKPLSAENGAR